MKIQGVETISTAALAQEVRRLEKIAKHESIVFLLGAGASVSSGIPPAGKLVEHWLREKYDVEDSPRPPTFEAWLASNPLGIDGFDPADLATSYCDVYERMFPNPDRGYDELVSLMASAVPGFGYAALAQILAGTRHKLVVTTNFDNLVEKCLASDTDSLPLVVGHEALAGAMSRRSARPVILKLHRDLMLEPKSDALGTSRLAREFADALDSALGDKTIVVIGYGGNDRSLMNYLGARPPKDLVGRVFWCHWQRDPRPPGKPVQDFLRARKGRLVPIDGFDQVMALLLDAVGATLPTEDALIGRAKRRASQLSDVLFRAPADPVDSTRSSDAGKAAAEADRAVAAAISNASKQGGDQASPSPFVLASSALSVKDKARRIELLERAVQDHPGSALLHRVLAVEYHTSASPERAESSYAEAIRIEPTHPDALGNYALFLKNVKKDEAKAAEYFERAVEADPTNAVNLGNYAVFLKNAKKDEAKAAEYYERAVKADPTNANNLGNYANFLRNMKGDDAGAAEYYERAVMADPTNANHLGNYALFLHEARKDEAKAAEYFERAVGADPTHARNLGNYAVFLQNVKKDEKKAAEYFERAVRADPTHARNLGNYAVFLRNVTKDHATAAEFYRRAVEADPTDAHSLGSYAGFLANVMRDEESATKFYEQAVREGPSHARNLGNYAVFLQNVKKDEAKAVEYSSRAVQADPTRANSLGNHAWLLFGAGRDAEALDALQRAEAAHRDAAPDALTLELRFYRYAHGTDAERGPALSQIRTLLRAGVRSPGWVLTRNVARAIEAGHPAGSWLPKLAQVVADAAPIESLDGWEDWRNA